MRGIIRASDYKTPKSLTTTKEVEKILPTLTEKQKCLISGILGCMAFYGTLITVSGLAVIMAFVVAATAGFFIAISSYPILGSFKRTTKIKINDDTSRDMIINAETKIQLLSSHLSANEPYKSQLERLIKEIKELISDLYQYPDKIFSSRDFLGYYLDSLNTILNNPNPMASPEEKINHIKSVDKLIESVYNAVRKRRKSLHNSNIKEIEVEITLLENELKSKGF